MRNGVTFFHSRQESHLQFLPDSAEKIAESINRTGLRDKLNQTVQEAIARANRSQQDSNHSTINQTVEVDSVDEASPK